LLLLLCCGNRRLRRASAEGILANCEKNERCEMKDEEPDDVWREKMGRAPRRSEKERKENMVATPAAPSC